MADLTFGNSVRQRREAAGITREDLARQIGISTSTLARIELQGHTPKVEALADMAAYFGITIDELLAPVVSA